jgi:hypothetical protein
VLTAAVGADPVSGPVAQAAARAELAHAEYAHGGRSWPARVLDWLGRRFADLGGGSGGTALLVVLAVLLAIAVFLAIRAGLPRRSTARLPAGEADLLAPAGARDHRRLATQHAAAGRRAEALREWLRAAVATIEERGVLPPRPGRTGAATAREAGPLLPDAAAALRVATAAFDEVWYGGRPATDADVAAAREAADAVRAAPIAAVRR